MAYCGTDDLKKIAEEKMLLRMADDAGTAAGLDDAAVAAVIEEATGQADSEIDSYLAARYRLPLASVPSIISTLSARMTVYYLTLRRDKGMDDKWESVYKRSVEILTQMAKGIITLGLPEIKADSPAMGKPCMVGIDSAFSRKKAF